MPAPDRVPQARDPAATVIRAGIFGIELDRFTEVGDRVIVVLFRLVCEAAASESDGTFRIELDRLIVVRNSAVVVALLVQRDGAIDDDARVPGSILNASLKSAMARS